jgi:glycosyltransferase involved in cell wall biosynthesis
LDSIPWILKRLPEVKFVFLNDGELRRVEGSVRFVGKLSYEDIPHYYVISDVFVSVPIGEALSMSLLEAMACGVVPVVGDLPSTRRWVIDGWNGYLILLNLRRDGSSYVFQTDKEMLVERIIEIIEDDELRRRYVQRGIDLVRAHGDHFKNMEKISCLYEGLI